MERRTDGFEMSKNSACAVKRVSCVQLRTALTRGNDEIKSQCTDLHRCQDVDPRRALAMPAVGDGLIKRLPIAAVNPYRSGQRRCPVIGDALGVIGVAV